MNNYFNSLNLRQQLIQLAQCRFMHRDEFSDACSLLKESNIVILGCGAQGLNQGLNMRDSGLNISYALRTEAITEKRASYQKATENGFHVGTFENLIPNADLVLNLTPDKQHSGVVKRLMLLMKKGATLSYSHAFNIVEEGMQIRPDITVIMVAPKCPGTEVRAEYKRGFGVPTLIAVHPENDPEGQGLAIAKAYASATGGDRAGVLHSSFIAEVKSDLMGEQTILCGMLQSGAILGYDKMLKEGIEPGYAAKLIQQGWQTISEALKQGGITNMMDRLSNPAKMQAFEMANDIKVLLKPLFEKHMDDIISGDFSQNMMLDWANNDVNLLKWRKQTQQSAFENAPHSDAIITEQTYFDKCIFLVAMLKAGVELAFDTMLATGIGAESAYYESLHETPLIADTIALKRLYQMNIVISDTAEYGCYLFNHSALKILYPYVNDLSRDVLGYGASEQSNAVDNKQLMAINHIIRSSKVEKVGAQLRSHMQAMQQRVIGKSI